MFWEIIFVPMSKAKQKNVKNLFIIDIYYQ